MVHSFPTRRSSDLSNAISFRQMRDPGREFPPIRVLRSEEHTSELQSHHPISYAVFCLKKKTIDTGVEDAFVEGRTPDEIDAELGESEAGRAWLEELERIKDPWFFFVNDTATYEIYTGWYTLSLHDALPI